MDVLYPYTKSKKEVCIRNMILKVAFASVIYLALFAVQAVSAASVVTLRIRPGEEIKTQGDSYTTNKDYPGVLLGNGNLAGGAFMEKMFHDVPGAKFIESISIEEGAEKGNAYLVNPTYFRELSEYGGCLYLSQFIYNTVTNEVVYGSASITIKLRGCETSADKKWRISKIDLGLLNIRIGKEPQSGLGNYTNPCKMTVNGKEVALDDTKEIQHRTVCFEGDEQRISEISLFTDYDAAVGLTSMDIYIEPEEGESGFNTPDPKRSRLTYPPADGIYRIPPCGQLPGVEYSEMSLAILDAEGNRMPVHTQYHYDGQSQEEYFCIMKSVSRDAASIANAGVNMGTNVGTDMETDEGTYPESPLAEGRYYACYYVGENPGGLSVESGIPFEVLPSVHGMSINWGVIEPIGNHYICYPQTEIRTGSRTCRWNNAHVSGHFPGTEVYWRLFTNAEAEEIISAESVAPMSYGMAKNAGGRNIRKAGTEASPEIPEGYRKLTASGIDISQDGTKDEEGGYLGLILRRNGVTSDSYLIKYEKSSVPTGVKEIEAVLERREFYTLEGVRTDASVSRHGKILLQIDHMSDGSVRLLKTRILERNR